MKQYIGHIMHSKKIIIRILALVNPDSDIDCTLYKLAFIPYMVMGCIHRNDLIRDPADGTVKKTQYCTLYGPCICLSISFVVIFLAYVEMIFSSISCMTGFIKYMY